MTAYTEAQMVQITLLVAVRVAAGVRKRYAVAAPGSCRRQGLKEAQRPVPRRSGHGEPIAVAQCCNRRVGIAQLQRHRHGHRLGAHPVGKRHDGERAFAPARLLYQELQARW